MDTTEREQATDLMLVEGEELVKLWVDALRSEKYNQCRYFVELEVGEERHHCCLGVLYRALDIPMRNQQQLPPGYVLQSILDSTGIAYSVFTKMNNCMGSDFDQIADLIEKAHSIHKTGTEMMGRTGAPVYPYSFDEFVKFVTSEID